ncbi:MAG TPA: DUF4231 domain-containing protein [Cytophagaceae bacterium]|nr:DUF4231 domain-containing protein [Cytophagaceae bacterium]
MNEQEYISERLEVQIKWYSKQSAFNKKWFYTFKIAEILLALSIPFLAGFISDSTSIKIAVGIVGVLVALISGLSIVFKFQEKWTNYRSTAESLKYHKFMYLNKAGMYENASISALTQNVENMILKENTDWSKLIESSNQEVFYKVEH